MLPSGKYQRVRSGMWHLIVRAGRWNPQLQEKILALVERQGASKHPQTFTLPCGGATGNVPLYLKVFYLPPGVAAVKDLFRQSKAARFFHQGLALRKAGFHAPETLAIGETHAWLRSQRAFVVTEEVGGQSLVSYLHDCWSGRKPQPAPAKKWSALKTLAEVVRKFHDLGFVHGDLVPSNLFIVERQSGETEFWFMDNDRTRLYPRWLPQSLWKRNLVQLNRFPLPGISLQDRMRFMHGYLAKAELGRKEIRLSRWLEAKTRKRRKECEDIYASVKFRELMRWNGPFAKHSG